MCTMIAERLTASGSGKGRAGWFALTQAYLSYDHPIHAPLDHALNLDFVNEESGLGARVAVELDPASAEQLALGILEVLKQAKAQGAWDSDEDTPPGQ